MKSDEPERLDLRSHDIAEDRRHGRPAAVLIGFGSEDDWFEYRLEHQPEFLRRVAEARAALAAGRGVRLEDIPEARRRRRLSGRGDR